MCAFLGIGNIGTPMATRLVNAGHDVSVWNRSVPRTAPLAQAGASVAVSPWTCSPSRRSGPRVRAKRANIAAGRSPPTFKLSLAAKDMRLAVDAADHAGAALKTAESVRRWLDEAADQGAAELDFSAVVATILGRPARPQQKGDQMTIRRIGLVVNERGDPISS